MSEPSGYRWMIASGTATIVLAFVALVGSAFLEDRLMGTSRIEQACKKLGIHEPIRRVLRHFLMEYFQTPVPITRNRF